MVLVLIWGSFGEEQKVEEDLEVKLELAVASFVLICRCQQVQRTDLSRMQNLVVEQGEDLVGSLSLGGIQIEHLVLVTRLDWKVALMEY